MPNRKKHKRRSGEDKKHQSRESATVSYKYFAAPFNFAPSESGHPKCIDEKPAIGKGKPRVKMKVAVNKAMCYLDYFENR
jgi:hypothetical protein